MEEAPSWYLLLHTTGEIIMAQTQDAVTTWPELAEGLYAFLTGRGATIEYSFNHMTVMVPRDTGAVTVLDLSGAVVITVEGIPMRVDAVGRELRVTADRPIVLLRRGGLRVLKAAAPTLEPGWDLRCGWCTGGG
jgi:hypothetical protein